MKDMAYLRSERSVKSIPEGKSLVHNFSPFYLKPDGELVGFSRGLGDGGFRAFTMDELTEDQSVCECPWAPEVAVHYTTHCRPEWAPDGHVCGAHPCASVPLGFLYSCATLTKQAPAGVTVPEWIAGMNK